MKRKNSPPKYIRGKIWGDNPRLLLKAADAIRNALSPFCTTTDVRPSREGDWHIMFNVYTLDEVDSEDHR